MIFHHLVYEVLDALLSKLNVLLPSHPKFVFNFIIATVITFWFISEVELTITIAVN